MLQPKRTKFRKMQKGRNRGVVVEASLNFGVFGLKSINFGRLSSAQIESARRVISRAIKRQGRIWICVFPDKPITEKPLEVRMGKGKGNIEYWVALIQPGRLLYEMDGVSEDLARHAFKLASAKLPVKTTMVVKDI